MSSESWLANFLACYNEPSSPHDSSHEGQSAQTSIAESLVQSSVLMTKKPISIMTSNNSNSSSSTITSTSASNSSSSATISISTSSTSTSSSTSSSSKSSIKEDDYAELQDVIKRAHEKAFREFILNKRKNAKGNIETSSKDDKSPKSYKSAESPASRMIKPTSGMQKRKHVGDNVDKPLTAKRYRVNNTHDDKKEFGRQSKSSLDETVPSVASPKPSDLPACQYGKSCKYRFDCKSLHSAEDHYAFGKWKTAWCYNAPRYSRQGCTFVHHPSEARCIKCERVGHFTENCYL